MDCNLKSLSLVLCGTGDSNRPSDILVTETRTCEILKKPPHPNLAQYLGCIYQGDRITALCFTKYETTLDAKLNNGQSIDREIFCSGIKRGLEHLHGLGFSHNDINPHSITFKSDGTSVIIDFDSCQVIGEKLMKGGGREDQIYSAADPENDWTGLGKIKEMIDREK